MNNKPRETLISTTDFQSSVPTLNTALKKKKKNAKSTERLEKRNTYEPGKHFRKYDL